LGIFDLISRARALSLAWRDEIAIAPATTSDGVGARKRTMPYRGRRVRWYALTYADADADAVAAARAPAVALEAGIDALTPPFAVWFAAPAFAEPPPFSADAPAPGRTTHTGTSCGGRDVPSVGRFRRDSRSP
jgi:hypothetical protein